MGNYNASLNPVNRYTAAGIGGREPTRRNYIKTDEGDDVGKVKSRRAGVEPFRDRIDHTLVDAGRAHLLSDAGTNLGGGGGGGGGGGHTSNMHHSSSAGNLQSLVSKISMLDINGEGDTDTEFFLLEMAATYLKVNTGDPNLKGILSRCLLPALRPLNCQPDFVVYAQGDHGTNCYLVESGKFKVVAGGIEVCSLERGSIFGELSLLFGYGRSATVTCVEKAVVWSLNRRTFAHVMSELSNPALTSNAKRFLDVPEFAALPNHYVERLMKQLHTVVYTEGQKLCSEGRGNTKIMLVESGQVDLQLPPYSMGLRSSRRELLQSLGAAVDVSMPKRTREQSMSVSQTETLDTDRSNDSRSERAPSAGPGRQRQGNTRSFLGTMPEGDVTGGDIVNALENARHAAEEDVTPFRGHAHAAGDMDKTVKPTGAKEGRKSGAAARGAGAKAHPSEKDRTNPVRRSLNRQGSGVPGPENASPPLTRAPSTVGGMPRNTSNASLSKQSSNANLVPASPRPTEGKRAQYGDPPSADAPPRSGKDAAVKPGRSPTVSPSPVKKRGGILPMISNMLGGAGGTQKKTSRPSSPATEMATGAAAATPTKEGRKKENTEVSIRNITSALGASLRVVTSGATATDKAPPSRRVSLEKKPTASDSYRYRAHGGNHDPDGLPSLTTYGEHDTHAAAAASDPGMDDEAKEARLEMVTTMVTHPDGHAAIRVGKGTVIGVGVLPSLMKAPGANKWRDEIEHGQPNVGSVAPCTAVAASDKVHVTYFTSYEYEKLFGSATSSLALFESREMANYFADAKAEADLLASTAATRSAKEDARMKAFLRGLPRTLHERMFFDVRELTPTALGRVVLACMHEEKYPGAGGPLPGSIVPHAAAAASVSKGLPGWKALSSLRQSFLGGAGNRGGGKNALTSVVLEALEEKDDGTDGVKETVKLKHFTLKVFYKDAVLRNGALRKVLNEVRMLGEKPISEHPLVPKLVARFRTKDALVMVMERVAPIVSDLWALIYDISELQGRKGGGADDAGKLSKVLSRRHNSATSHMTSDMIKFYLASVIVVLSDLHKAGIAFRNLKAENVLIDATGYIKLTGFGHAKRFPLTDGQHMKNRTHTVCGTAEYMAPEIIMHSGHNLSADAWALGCLMYELLEGKTPFATAAEVVRNRGGRRMLSRAEDADCRVMAAVAETQHKGVRLNPAAVSELEGIPGALPLITGLLHPVPANRLLISTKPSSDIVKSPFFKDFDWAALRNLTLPAPFQPTFPAETSDEEKERIRREAELAALAALASAPVAYVKPSYLESTVASVASRAEEAERRKVAEKRRNERRDDEVVEAKHSPFFDASVPYGGDNSIFAEF